MRNSPLDARASREFARSLVKGSVESSALELLIKRAAGNPLYLEQLVLAVATALYLGAAVALVATLRRKAHARPPLLSATLAELRQDRDALRGGSAGTP